MKVSGVIGGGALMLLYVCMALGSAQPEPDVSMQIFREERLNERAIKPSADLADWKGLKCRVYLRASFNPNAGMQGGTTSGISMSGLGSTNEIPTFAQGVLAEVSEDAIVVSGPNGHVWMPRREIHAVEFIQNPPTKRPGGDERNQPAQR